MAGSTDKYDIAVLGGGAAGFAAALRASELGARVCLIEKDRPGGSCFRGGLYPLRSALVALESRRAAGAPTERDALAGDKPDAARLFEDANDIAEAVSRNRRETLGRKGIAFKNGNGLLVSKSEILVRFQDREELVRAGKIVLATGSAADPMPSMPFDKQAILPGDGFFALRETPESVLIVGGGKAGCEMAVLLKRLGSKVFLCDENPRLAQGLDADIVSAVEAEMKRQKIKLLLGKKLVSIFKDGSKINVSLESGIKFSVDTIVVTNRRKANTDGMEASPLGLRLGESREVLVDEKMESSVPGVYAAGSVARCGVNVNLSEEEGKVAAENALGKEKKLNPDYAPLIIYTDPEAASVGCSVKDAHYRGFRAVEGRCDYNMLDRSFIDRGAGAGLFKVVADKPTKKVIGVHLFGAGAAEAIPWVALAIKRGLTATDLATLSCGWPTQLQGIKIAARSCLETLAAGK